MATVRTTTRTQSNGPTVCIVRCRCSARPELTPRARTLLCPHRALLPVGPYPENTRPSVATKKPTANSAARPVSLFLCCIANWDRYRRLQQIERTLCFEALLRRANDPPSLRRATFCARSHQGGSVALDPPQVGPVYGKDRRSRPFRCASGSESANGQITHIVACRSGMHGARVCAGHARVNKRVQILQRPIEFWALHKTLSFPPNDSVGVEVVQNSKIEFFRYGWHRAKRPAHNALRRT
jgi:hypothetical protein